MSRVMEEAPSELHAATDWKAGVLAGLIAGVAFLMLEIALVWMVQGMSPWGPPYMMAAMVLGADALPAKGIWAVFDLKIVMIAMMIHFPMAVIYDLWGAWLVHRFDLAVDVLIGAGLCLAPSTWSISTSSRQWLSPGSKWVATGSVHLRTSYLVR